MADQLLNDGEDENPSDDAQRGEAGGFRDQQYRETDRKQNWANHIDQA